MCCGEEGCPKTAEVNAEMGSFVWAPDLIISANPVQSIEPIVTYTNYRDS